MPPDEPRQPPAQQPSDESDEPRAESPEPTFWVGLVLIALASGLWIGKFLGWGTVDYQFIQLFVVAGLVLIAGKEAIQGAIDALTK